jgi:radical SAM protein with 4Fe4S-binding SPASM domain
MKAVRCCVWEITLACNLRCSHCGATAGQARRDELTPAEAQQLAGELAALPCLEVTLMGGELFLRSDWLAIAERLHSEGVELVLFTNGLLLDPKSKGAGERLAQVRALAPRSVGVSLDGPTAAVHDAQRGARGALERTWRAVDSLSQAGVPVSAITTLTRHNLYHLPALARQLVGHGIRWQVQIASPNGGRMGPGDLLTPLEFYWAGAWLNLARHKYDWTVLPVAGAHDLGHHSARLGSVLPPGCAWEGCTAGLDTLGIQSHGGVKGCLSLPDRFVEGNIRQRPIAELWHDPKAFALNRHFRPELLSGYCASCPYGPACRGGCSDLAQASSGSPYENAYCFRRIEAQWPA